MINRSNINVLDKNCSLSIYSYFHMIIHIIHMINVINSTHLTLKFLNLRAGYFDNSKNIAQEKKREIMRLSSNDEDPNALCLFFMYTH